MKIINFKVYKLSLFLFTMKKMLIAVVCIAIAIVLMYYYRCELHCQGHKENMTAGLSTTTGLSFYNKGEYCSGENAMGSNDPYCSSIGYVLY